MSAASNGQITTDMAEMRSLNTRDAATYNGERAIALRATEFLVPSSRID